MPSRGREVTGPALAPRTASAVWNRATFGTSEPQCEIHESPTTSRSTPRRQPQRPLPAAFLVKGCRIRGEFGPLPSSSVSLVFLLLWFSLPASRGRFYRCAVVSLVKHQFESGLGSNRQGTSGRLRKELGCRHRFFSGTPTRNGLERSEISRICDCPAQPPIFRLQYLPTHIGRETEKQEYSRRPKHRENLLVL